MEKRGLSKKKKKGKAGDWKWRGGGKIMPHGKQQFVHDITFLTCVNTFNILPMCH